MTRAGAWSPDGQFAFLAQDLTGAKYGVHLLRVEGTETSSPITLKPDSTVRMRATWQPQP
jgi:hypothetical protein